jgi:uncharacterized protein (DUF2147 family)
MYPFFGRSPGALLRIWPSGKGKGESEMTSFVSAVAGGLAALGAAGAAAAADLTGSEWLTAEGDARIAFATEDDALVGRIVWLQKEDETGEPVLDDKNVDESLRTRPLVGAVMAWGFEQTRDDVWDHGRVYAADDGKTYNAKMTLEGDALVLTGCIRWPLCRDSTWTRAEE